MDTQRVIKWEIIYNTAISWWSNLCT